MRNAMSGTISKRKGYWLGKKLIIKNPIERARKISMALKGRKGRAITDEQKQKQREKMLGRKMPPRSKEHLEKLSGENASNWRGGVTPLRHLIRSSFQYRQWRCDIFTRANYLCENCGAKGYLEAHHIKPFFFILRQYAIKTLDEAILCPELWDINNGMALCEDCHLKTDTFGEKAKNFGI